MFPAMYPAVVPGLTPPQNDELAQGNRGAGIYAVPVHPFNQFNGHVTGLPYNNLIPLTYRTPTQRAAAPPQPPRPAAPRAENVPAARQGADNAAPAEGQPEAEVGNQPVNDGNRAAENENEAEPGRVNGGNQWWGIVKEIQMIVFGFITSLLPGFHNHMD
ncbi:hypothetical protein Ahy_B04g070573 isoform D [Arachis hypogaea]|uniref:Uncharacterized protein n=1 Tax=Arachis hypogaea TaxID=3818 RepID=A0A444ZHR8_ARAHY|nr:hypothetical protein Ahy_B04g070573 isoform D [Arachis hypogaea]